MGNKNDPRFIYTRKADAADLRAAFQLVGLAISHLDSLAT